MTLRTRLLAAVGAIALLPAGQALAQTEIRVAHTHQGDFSSEIHTAAWIFANYVNDNSETLDVSVYPNNALGEEREVYEGMQLGAGATCTISGTAILNNFTDRVGILDLPFIWQGYDHVHAVLDGPVGDALAEELGAQGFEVLAWMDSWGYRNVVTTEVQVAEPSDLEGLKLRTIPTPIYVAAINAMGANATPMNFGEVYTALETGVLDGFEHGAAVVVANRFYEVANHVALTRHLFGPLVMSCSSTVWETLSPEEQALMREAAVFARDVQRSLAPLREREAFDYLRDQGMTITEVDTDVFVENARSVQDELAAEMGAGDLLEQIRTAAASN